MTKYKYKFSVIIPIYNVEEYLEETILSVVNQTIGFENNIQLILVNDGSPDNSEEICLKYKKLYPDNIVYVKQKNGGVSSARNKGMGYIEGEFVNFLDSDDIWSKDVMHEIYNQHRRHPHIKLFSCRMRFFDMVKGNHPLNYKYTHNKIINIMEEYEYPQLSSSSIFIKTTALKNHKYDSTIKYSEDNKFINEIIFEQGKYMVLKKPTYYYRRRQNLKSAIQNQIDDRSYYFVTPEKVYNYLFELSKEKFGRVIEYIQYLVMYEINWRTNANATKVLDKSENKKYASLMRNLLSNIDPDIIMSVRNADLAKKVYMYDLKKKGNCIDNINYEEGKMKLFDLEITSENLGYLIIDTIYFKNNKMYLYGKLDTKFVPKNKFTVKVNNKIQKPKFYDLTNDYDESSFDGTKLHSYVGISFELKVEPTAKINFFFSEFLLTPRFKRNSVFYERMPRSYHRYNKKLVYYDKEKKEIRIVNDSYVKRFIHEIRNLSFLITHKKSKVAAIRLYITLSSIFKKKKIMLISDRVNKADDNGEHFFKFMIEKHPEYKTYFILSKDSVDYERMCKIGPVLDNNSTKYKLLFQKADYIVSSHAEDYIYNILGKNNKFVQDKYYFKYIFLQHGIIKDDLSPWLNINTKKMDMFVTSATKEYESLLECDYYFGKNIVKLTGLPRYDSLVEKQKEYPVKKQILLSCTWRNSLASKINKKTGERLYNEEFKESNYFKFLNSLMNDKHLLKVLKEKEYTIKFCPHPNVLTQLDDFEGNDYVYIETGNINYQKEFCENALLITDFSSVFFDFAYLNKPVIYIQHDRKEFFEGQLYNEGYFDYKKLGFGPVCENYEDSINTIIKYIENDCVIEKKYQNRINNFYTYHDNKNCERVLKEIEKL